LAARFGAAWATAAIELFWRPLRRALAVALRRRDVVAVPAVEDAAEHRDPEGAADFA
jgi:hypothetical protein